MIIPAAVEWEVRKSLNASSDLVCQFVKLATLQTRSLQAKPQQPHCFNNSRAVESRTVERLLSSLRTTVWERHKINEKALNLVPHRHKCVHPVQAAALETGRGSGSPPGPPHNHTDSEWESRFWSLNTLFQMQEKDQINAQLWSLFVLQEDDITHWCRIHQGSPCNHSDSSTCNSHSCSCSGAHRDEVSGRTRSDLQTSCTI